MLRLFAYAYFAIALVEICLVPLGQWGPMPGMLASATSVFFGAVLLGLAIIVEEIRALRDGRSKEA